jgi:hypothetical protein
MDTLPRWKSESISAKGVSLLVRAPSALLPAAYIFRRLHELRALFHNFHQQSTNRFNEGIRQLRARHHEFNCASYRAYESRLLLPWARA